MKNIDQVKIYGDKDDVKNIVIIEPYPPNPVVASTNQNNQNNQSIVKELDIEKINDIDKRVSILEKMGEISVNMLQSLESRLDHLKISIESEMEEMKKFTSDRMVSLKIESNSEIDKMTRDITAVEKLMGTIMDDIHSSATFSKKSNKNNWFNNN